MQVRFGSAVGMFVAAAALAMSGCKPTYPNCKDDEGCAEKGEVCTNGTCQECRTDGECGSKYPGETRTCKDGRCEVKAECASDEECSAKGMVCRSNKCVPECSTDDDCPTDSKCQAQHCVAGKTTNISSACQPADPTSGDVIALGKIHFEFDKYDLTSAARSTLDQNAQCLQESAGVSIVLEGHCDQRGTQEYNLALGEKRANTVKSYLRNLGVDDKRMQTRSKGANEPTCREATEDCWTENRRVEFIQKRGL